MSNTSPGIVAVTTFCRSNSKVFSRYLSYMDRPEAVKRKHIKDYDMFAEYMDYMGNQTKTLSIDFEHPERITGIFTSSADELSAEQIQSLKEVYKTAQVNGSLMWQTVLSFDNKWLADVGLYDVETCILDERRVKNAARKAINGMLEKENLQAAVWSASLHYNTDNIHIHISTVEPSPMRQKKHFKQYEVEQRNGKWQYKKVRNEKTGKYEKVPILDADGNIKTKEEYVGRFNESSLNLAKSTFVNEVSTNKDLNIAINQIIRERILEEMKQRDLVDDVEFKAAFQSIYNRLPENCRHCFYKSKSMEPLRSEIDALSLSYIEKYHGKDYEELLELLEEQQSYYDKAYGGSKSDFAQNKLNDLLYRMGNSILDEMKTYGKKIELESEKEENQKKKDLTSYQVDKKLDKEDVDAEYIYQTNAAPKQECIKRTYLLICKNQQELNSAMYWLQRSLNKDYERYLNMKDYDELQFEIENYDSVELG